jgi:hypothetical protein
MDARKSLNSAAQSSSRSKYETAHIAESEALIDWRAAQADLAAHLARQHPATPTA